LFIRVRSARSAPSSPKPPLGQTYGMGVSFK
jgi:hypothetical protein